MSFTHLIYSPSKSYSEHPDLPMPKTQPCIAHITFHSCPPLPPPALSSSTLSNPTPHISQLEITIRLLTPSLRKRSDFLRESDLQSPRALGAELVDGREVEGQCVEGGVLFY
jgi:hypothetical protein